MADALKLNQFSWQGFRFPGSATNTTISATDSGLAFAFQPYSADPITHLGFRYGARTGTPPTYSIRLEGLDSSGLPDNTDVGGGSPTAVTFTPPADTTIDGLWQWKALTNAYTPTRGQFVCSTIRYSSGTVNASNCSSFSRNFSNALAETARGFPYALTESGGAWTKQNNACFGWRTATGRYGWIMQGTYSTLTANTAGHKSGMYFTLPSTWGSTFKVASVHLQGKLGTAAGSCKVCIYQTDGTLLQSVTVDSDFCGSPGQDPSIPNLITFSDTSLATLNYGTKYYVVIEVVSGTCGIGGITLAEAADASCMADGVNRGLVTYNGSFTETATTIPLCDIILDDITAPSGGSGMLFIPDMAGT